MEKPNCYKCKHRGNVPGDAHSCCVHPEIKKNVTEEMYAALGIGGISSPSAAKFKIQANSHGVQQGWFMWPVNFDPVWLENCDGFEEK